MKRKTLLRALFGFPMGICVGYVITIVISMGWAQGYYAPCVPSLVQTMGSEINAVIFQAVLSGLLGSTFAACSVIWEIESWSIAKQTGTYFLITALVMMPIAYFTNWMECSILGFVRYFGIFVLFFVVVWVIQYFSWKRKIKKINLKLNR